MTKLVDSLSQAMAAMSGLELVAVILAIVYLLLAIRQNALCWPAAMLSCGIYIWLMFAAGLYMESALQVFYIAMACYGWYSWSRSAAGGLEGRRKLAVTSWPLIFHLLPLSIIALLTFLSGWLLSAYSDAAMPYLDSFTTWSAIFTTWMVARKILQNWHYWFVIDSVSVYLYASRGLPLTALLFCVYLILILIGYRVWRRSMLGS